jgi:opacity protein-like surface antigen
MEVSTMNAPSRRTLTLLDRAIVGTLILLTLVLLGIQTSQAGEIVPSVGLTRTVDSDNDAQMMYGLAFRGALAPFLKSEIGIGYRNETVVDDALDVRTWPVTASLYLTPGPVFYAGAGVGFYNTTFDYAEGLPFEDETQQDFGMHVAGGFNVPLATNLALDLNGRYVWMEDQESPMLPTSFDPDFWTSSLGLAIKF